MNHKINLERILGTTIGYSLVGSFFSPQQYVVPAVATIGLAASVADEVSGGKVDLARPAWAGFLGGFAGSLVAMVANDPSNPMYHMLCGALGAGIGAYRSYACRDREVCKY